VKTFPPLVSRTIVLYEILAFSLVSFRVCCVALVAPSHQVSFSFTARHSLLPPSFLLKIAVELAKVYGTEGSKCPKREKYFSCVQRVESGERKEGGRFVNHAEWNKTAREEQEELGVLGGQVREEKEQQKTNFR